MSGTLFPERIETDRLDFERLRSANLDLLEFYRLCSADDMAAVTRYMPWDPHETPKETAEFVDRSERQWDEGAAATYLLRPRETEEGSGEIAGIGALECDWDRRTGELGIWLRKRFWGRGYSGERATALIKLAFERLDLELVAVTHHVDNESSRAAIEEYVAAHGGRREGRLRNWLPYGDEVADEVRYTISREEYEGSR